MLFEDCHLRQTHYVNLSVTAIANLIQMILLFVEQHAINLSDYDKYYSGSPIIYFTIATNILNIVLSFNCIGAIYFMHRYSDIWWIIVFGPSICSTVVDVLCLTACTTAFCLENSFNGSDRIENMFWIFSLINLIYETIKLVIQMVFFRILYVYASHFSQYELIPIHNHFTYTPKYYGTGL